MTLGIFHSTGNESTNPSGSESQNAVDELVKFGGGDGGGDNKVILATLSSGKAMNAVLGGLSVNGKLIMIGSSNDTVEVPPLLFISGGRSIVGWPTGTSIDSQDMLSFSVFSGVRSVNEVFPLERAPEPMI